MHETRFIQQIFTALEEASNKKAPLAQVTVNVRLSPLSHVSAGNLKAAFKELSIGTKFKGASLNVLALKLPLVCNSCDRKAMIVRKTFGCPSCGSADVTIAMDKEFFVESIDLKPEVKKSRKKRMSP
ncbi:MAG: hydrogenase maturation nickel metallochaperone HypA [Candidatus Omnitrophota bacterium]